MRFKLRASVATALVVLISTIQLLASIPVQAHGNTLVSRHHIQTPPATNAVQMNNVIAFGATGNGVTDDTAAIQNAANNASTGKGVYFPPGTYLHNSTITFSGIQVTGSGTSTYLNAGATSGSNCAIILTGQNVSLSNMLISTASVAGISTPSTPLSAAIFFQYASPFTLSNITLVTGVGRFGVYVTQSAVGAIDGCYFNGTGNPVDLAIFITQCSNVSISNNVFQYEYYCVYATGASPSQFISIVSNIMGTVTYPTIYRGIFAQSITNLYIAQNTIQAADSTLTIPIDISFCDLCTVQGNNLWGGQIGMSLASLGPIGTQVIQNTLRNCGGAAIFANDIASSALQIVSNSFGECGLLNSWPVILIAGPGADASGATTFVLNNSYQGHTNNLNSYVQCTYTAPHIPAANVAGNTQTQTALPNNI